MTHEQLQAAQRAALSMGLNINSEQAAAIAKAALGAQQESDPVAYVLFRDGEVCYEADDNIVISNLPGDSSDLFQWLPVYTAPAALQKAEPILVEAVATVVGDEEEGLRLSWLLEGGISALEHPGTVLLVAQGQLTDDEGSGYVIPVSDSGKG